MATYKVPQNVEAEDKLLGPFSFRQFIYLLVAALGIFIAYLLVQINGWLIIIPLPFILVFAFLGIYHREDQPVETYILAALNYFFKPRQRLWSAEGETEAVHLTAPKKVAGPILRQLSSERGQLNRLAHIMDTRGWSIKRPELTEPLSGHRLDYDDRLVMPQAAATEEAIDIHAHDDLLDPYNYSDAQKYTDLAQSTSINAKKSALKKMQSTLVESAKVATKLPQKVKFAPYPKIKQTVVEPGSGQLKSRPKPKSKPTTKAIHELAQENELPVSQVAKRAKALRADGGLEPGEEVALPHGK